MEGVFIMRIVWDIEKIKTFVESETDCELLSSEYRGYTVPMEFRCSCGNEFKKTWHKFKSGVQRTCPECSVKRTAKAQRKTYKEFEKEVRVLVGDEYVFHEYKQANTKVKVTHKNCGNSYLASPSHFLCGKRCPHCNGGSYLGETAFKKKLIELYSGEIELSGEFKKMHELTAFKNTIYDIEFYAYPTNVIQGYSLGRKISYGEHVIKTWLERRDVAFEYQIIFPNLKKRAFDFYIPSKNIAIEYDGEQHFRPVKHFGGVDKYKRQVKSDKIKTNYCSENNIKLIRIPYWQFDEIETILEDAIL